MGHVIPFFFFFCTPSSCKGWGLMSGVSSERIHISFIPRERTVTPLSPHCDLIEDKEGIRYYLVPKALVEEN